MAPARNDTIELLRYVCAAGIVWFHLGGPYGWVGHAALLVFVILSVSFSVSQGKTTWRRTRVLRLWLFWSVFYGLLKVAQAVALGRPVASEFEWWMVLTGPALPLWFLPFIYVANGLASTYDAWVKDGGWKEAVVLPVLTVGCIALIPFSPGIPFSQWLLGASGVFMAFSLLRARQEPIHFVIMFAIFACAFWFGPRHDMQMLLLALCVGSAALFIAPMMQSRWASQLGEISLGVYVLHPCVTVAMRGVVYGYPIMVQIGIVIIICTILALTLKRVPVFRSFI